MPPGLTGSGGGGGGGGAPANGHYQEGPFGNWANEYGDWFDAWGNRIPHGGYVPGGGGPGTPADMRVLVDQNPDGTPIGQPPGAPVAPVAPAAAPPVPSVMPTTFYGPGGQSNYLQFQNQWLGLLDPNTRLALDEQLQRAGYKPTGQIGQYGETSYLDTNGPAANDLSFILDPALRQWVRFFLGQLGYNQSYQLPASYVPGSGTPLPPGYVYPPGYEFPGPGPRVPTTQY